MTKREKRLDKLRQNPRNVSFDELRTVLEDWGFVFQRASGSHHIFSIEIDGTPEMLVIPFSRPIKTAYVRQAIELIDQLLDLSATEASDDE